MIIRKFLFLFLIIVNHPASSTSKLGFDEICAIYTEAMNSNMSKELLSQYVFDNIEKRVTDVDALDAHGSVFHLPPEDRYLIFKQGAEISLKRTWDCKAIKMLMK